MSTPPPGPRLNLRGAVDLSGLARRPAPGAAPGTAAGAPAAAATPASAPREEGASPFVVEVTDATFAEVVQLSSTVPVVLDLRANWAEPSAALSPVLERLAAAAAGTWLLGQVDVEASPQIAQAFQVQSVPTVVAVVKGQPVPLFTGAQTEEQVVRVIDALMAMAAQNGVTGRLGDPGAAQEAGPPAYEVEALEALERGDTDAALAAYTAALAANPREAGAVSGIARVHLLVRVAGVDATAARAAAAADPDDVDAALAVADVDVVGGHVADAFDRLVALLRRTAGDERDRVRERLLELFDVAGPDESAVVAGRRAMTTALF